MSAGWLKSTTEAALRDKIKRCPQRPENEVVQCETPEHSCELHEDVVTSSKFFNNGALVCSTSRDHTAAVWDVETTKLIHHLIGHTGAVRDSCMCVDDKLLCTVGDSTARLWDLNSGKLVRTLYEHQGFTHSVSAALDGRQMAVATSNNAVVLWNTRIWECFAVLGEHEKPVHSAVYTADSTKVLTCSSDCTLRVWNVQEEPRLILQTLRGHQRGVFRCRYSVDSKRICSGGLEHEAGLWTFRNGSETLWLLSGHNGTIWDCCFAHDSKSILTASHDSTVRLWNVSNKIALCSFQVRNPVWSCDFHPAGQLIVSGCGSGLLSLWRVPQVDLPEKEKKKPPVARAESGAVDVAQG